VKMWISKTKVSCKTL